MTQKETWKGKGMARTKKMKKKELLHNHIGRNNAGVAKKKIKITDRNEKQRPYGSK